MCKLKRIFVFMLLTLSCNKEKSMEEFLEESKKENVEEQRQLRKVKQENENLLKQRNYYCCDLHKDVKNLELECL